MKPEDFRNYTISAKVTARQKNAFTVFASQKGLTLSEWVGSQLDYILEKGPEVILLTKENEKLKRDTKLLTTKNELLELKNESLLDRLNFAADSAPIYYYLTLAHKEE